jgi:signal transduction histidine kinase
MSESSQTNVLKSYKPKLDIVPFVILVGIVLATVIGWYSYNNYILASAEEKFNKEVDIIVEKIEQRLVHYAQILYSSRGLFAASNEVERDEWHEFIESQKISARFPGIQGVGFQKYVTDKDIFLKDMEELRILDLLNRDPPAADQNGNYGYIFFLDPINERNKNAFGYNMFSDNVRREALERSQKYDTPALSGKVILVQEITENKQFGFLLYLPIYANNAPHSTLVERNTNLIGHVYQPFRMGDFMDGIVTEKITELDFFIFDQSESDENLMYNYNQVQDLTKDRALFTKSITSNNYGRDWIIQFNGYDTLISFNNYLQSYTILFGGLITSVVVAYRVRIIRKKKYEQQEQDLSFKIKEIQQSAEIEQLKEISIMKSEFVSMISHELKTPLVMILGYSEMLLNFQSKTMSAEQKENIKEIHTNAFDLSHIINDLLDTQKLELSEISLSKTTVNVNELVENVLSRFTYVTGDKITLSSQIDEQITLNCDKSRIKQVLNNLIKNAIEAIKHENGKIKVIVKKDLTNVIFSVYDNGSGMSEETLKNLFHKFYQTDMSLTRKSHGSGLGLYISRELVLLHNGKIWVDSILDKETTIFFSIPL